MARLETYINEDDLVNRIHQLRMEKDVNNNQLTLFSNTSFESVELNEDIEKKSIDGTAGDKIVTYFSAGEPEDRRMADLGLTHEQQEVYNYAIEHHQYILYINHPDLDGVFKSEMKDMPYDRDTEVVDMEQVNDDRKEL